MRINNNAGQTFLTTLVVAIVCLVASCRPAENSKTSAETTFARIKAEKKIVAGWAPYAPYASMNLQTRQPEGFYLELFKRMTSEAGFEIEWVETTWGTMISDLKAGRFQVMAAPVFRTIPRAEEVAFTRAVDYFGLSAVVRKDETRFKNVSDFDRPDVTVAVTQGEVGHEFASRRLTKAKLGVHKTGDISLALVDAIQGKADAAICDSWTAKLFAREHKDTVVDLFGDNPFNRVGAGWFVRQEDTTLLEFLNTAIDWLESSGTIQDTAKNYELASFPK